MKAQAVIALLIVGLACGASAQRSASRGMSGHASPSFSGPSFSRPSFSGPTLHGGFTSSPRPGFAAPSGYNSSRSFNAGQTRVYAASPSGRSYSPAKAYRRPYLPPVRGRRILYVRPGFYAEGNPWLAPGLIGYPAGYGDAVDQSSSSEGSVNSSEGEQAVPDQSMSPELPYPSAYDGPPPPPAPRREDAVTLIFKDGRPPEQIYNYALTRTMIYVRDDRPRDIILTEVDIGATEKANHDAGVDFKLPEASR